MNLVPSRARFIWHFVSNDMHKEAPVQCRDEGDDILPGAMFGVLRSKATSCPAE